MAMIWRGLPKLLAAAKVVDATPSGTEFGQAVRQPQG